MYKALYRKYRPVTFDDVVSQPHITRTLTNQIVNSKTAHAYLFTGSRGTGKTTCARILAKAVNCLNPVNGNPCLECEICRDAENDALSDIIEIDAASNSSVEDIRDLREGTVYSPERCKYKVYIIDEVHMLSPSAFNALLKIMEEPPPHVKFILATTEIHKVLPTILSRCQRFDFRRILAADIKQRLIYVAEKEGISLEESAAELIAKTADGGMRDALSLLDQCIAFSENVTSEVVASAAGIAGREYLFEIVAAAAEKDPAKAIMVTDRLYAMSKDMQKLCAELIAQFRNIMLAKTVPGNNDLLVCMPEEIKIINETAQKLSVNEIFGKLDILRSCSERIARSADKRVEMEMCLIKLCSNAAPAGDGALNPDLTARIDRLERELAALRQAPQTYRQPQPAAYAPAQTAQPPAAAASAQAAAAGNQPAGSAQSGTDFKKLDPNKFTSVPKWAEIMELFSESCPPVSAALSGSYAVEQQDYMLIYTENSFFMELLRNKENANKLLEAITRVTGKVYKIRAKCTAKEENASSESPLEGLLKKAEAGGVPTGEE